MIYSPIHVQINFFKFFHVHIRPGKLHSFASVLTHKLFHHMIQPHISLAQFIIEITDEQANSFAYLLINCKQDFSNSLKICSTTHQHASCRSGWCKAMNVVSNVHRQDSRTMPSCLPCSACVLPQYGWVVLPSTNLGRVHCGNMHRELSLFCCGALVSTEGRGGFIPCCLPKLACVLPQ